MKRIIVPTNFSETAWNAAMHALEYAQILNAKIILLNTFEESFFIGSVLIASKEELKSNSANRLSALKKEVQKQDAARGIQIEVLSLQGTLSNVLSDLVTTKGNDLIVLGAKSREELAGKLFGNKASKIVEGIDCPILVIPPRYKFNLSNCIACAISEFGNIEDADIILLTEIVANYYTPVLKLLHIATEQESLKGNLVLPFSEFDSLDTEYVDLIGENLPQILENYIFQKKLNCLILLKKDRSFMEKLFCKNRTSEVITHAHVPLLILRSE